MDDNTDDSLADSIPYGMHWYSNKDRLLAREILEKLVASGNVNRKNKDNKRTVSRKTFCGNIQAIWYAVSTS